MTHPPITRGAWVLAAIFGLLMLIGCGAIISCGVRMQRALDEHDRPVAASGRAERVRSAIAAELWHEQPWADRGVWSDYDYGQVVYSVQTAPDGDLVELRADPTGAQDDDRQGVSARAAGVVMAVLGQDKIGIDALEIGQAAGAGADRSGIVRNATEIWVDDGVIIARPVRAPAG